MKIITLAVKCAPERDILQDIEKAGLKAVELYTSRDILSGLPRIIKICRSFSFLYAVHVPSDGSSLDEAAELAKEIGARSVVFHNIYWEDEWRDIIKTFENTSARLCVENIYSVIEPLKLMRKYNLGRCLDLEHLQIECAGVFEEEFIPIIKQASHIHLTGYIYGSQLWHTPIHYSQKHSLYFLNLLKKSGYTGLVVSEARVSYQTYEEFRALNEFFCSWQGKRY